LLDYGFVFMCQLKHISPDCQLYWADSA